MNNTYFNIYNSETATKVEDITNVKTRNISTVEKFIKRFGDIIAGLIGIILLIPITIGIKIANIINKDYGPVFLVQKRIGKDGKLFKFYKYRSMVVGADKKLKELLANDEEARKEYKKFKKLRNDPRITKVGNFIRKTSLDEFPQFINVLKGDMSLVGPRPYLYREKRDMGPAYWRIVKCKPGLTGIWQVRGRSDVDFNERIEMDLQYYYERSTKLDIKLILQTIKKVILKEGAL